MCHHDPIRVILLDGSTLGYIARELKSTIWPSQDISLHLGQTFGMTYFYSEPYGFYKSATINRNRMI